MKAMTTTATNPHPTPMALVPSSFDELESLSAKLSKSSIVPEAYRNKPEDIFVAIAKGLELKLLPMAALDAIAVIRGRATLYANTMVGLIHSSGLADYFDRVESDSTKATYATKRKNSPQRQTTTFTIEDAKRAGLTTNSTWQKYPEAMLCARAKSILARDTFPDVLRGMYSTEEIQDMPEVEVSGSDFVAPMPPPEFLDASIVEKEVDAQEIGMRLLEATTIHELEEIKNEVLPLIEKIEGEKRVELRKLYADHSLKLTQSETA